MDKPFFAALGYTCAIEFTFLMVEIAISENLNPRPERRRVARSG
jgi:hypothetical protein